MTAVSVHTGQRRLPGPAPHPGLPDRAPPLMPRGWWLRWASGHCPVLSRRGRWGRGGAWGRCGQPWDPHVCSLPVPAALGPCPVCESGARGPPQWGGGTPGPLRGCPLPTPTPGRCRRACQQGRDESRSSDWPLRHRRPRLPAKGWVFSLVLDRLCGFYKLSSFISFQALVFQQGENLQEGNFPLGSCY